MKRFIALSLILVTSYVQGELSLHQVAQLMRHNVVALNVELTESTNLQSGFGWIIGQDKGKLFIVTADHVLTGPDRFDEASIIDVRLFEDPIESHIGTVTQVSSADNFDVAVITIPLPNRRPWLYASSSMNIQTGMPVTFIGKAKNEDNQDDTWVVPEGSGIVFAEADEEQIESEGFNYIVKNLDLDVGTSGAPLISKNGIVGMIVTNSQEGTGIVSMDKIKEIAVDESKINWRLSDFNLPHKLEGDWTPKTANVPPGIMLRFIPKDAAHFKYELSMPHEETYLDGVGVVDGDSVRIWQPMINEESYGEFGFFLDDKQNPNEIILMQGNLVHGDIETRVRLAKLKNNQVDPRTAKAMQDNPSMIESMVKRMVQAPNKDITDENGIPVSFDMADRIALTMGAEEGKLLPILYREMARNGITGVNFSIKNFDMQSKCYVAQGKVSSVSRRKVIDKILDKVVQKANNSEWKGFNQYQACNKTMLQQGTVNMRKSDFDFDSELIQPQALVDAIMPGVKLSVDDKCLTAKGKLPSSMHKGLLAKAMSDLARQLTDKSNTKIVACDKTSI